MNSRDDERLIDVSGLVFAFCLATALAVWVAGIFGSAWVATLIWPNAGIAVGAFAYLFISFVFVFYIEARA